jgi:hypothetical protein
MHVFKEKNLSLLGDALKVCAKGVVSTALLKSMEEVQCSTLLVLL